MTLSLRTSLFIWLLLMAALPVESRMVGGVMGYGIGGLMGSASSNMPYLPPLIGVDGHRYEYFEPTQLAPVFPEGFSCTPPASYFGSPDDNGGINLKLPEGTPLLAISAGEVIAKGQSADSDGNFLWLRFAPEDTGQPFWTFVKYQHLLTEPPIKIGTHVKIGEIVGLSGSSARSGQGHDDDKNAYSQFNLATLYGSSAEFRLGGRYQSVVKGLGAKLGDPMILYVGNIGKPADAHELLAKHSNINVPVVGQDGAVFPVNSKTVWPVTCH